MNIIIIVLENNCDILFPRSTIVDTLPEHQVSLSNSRKHLRAFAPTSSTPAIKRSKIKDGGGPTNVLSLADEEFGDEESVMGEDRERENSIKLAPFHSNGRSGSIERTMVLSSTRGSGSGDRTLPIQMDEAEMKKKVCDCNWYEINSDVIHVSLLTREKSL